jgi:hypothetical protein
MTRKILESSLRERGPSAATVQRGFGLLRGHADRPFMSGGPSARRVED